MTSFSRTFVSVVLLLLPTVLGIAGKAKAQSFGYELHNSLMPASGGMAGTSIARPQDVQSAINGNPATLTQFHGTHFALGGAWIESTFDIDQWLAVPGLGITPYSQKSGTPGTPLGNFGVTQDLSALGIPATWGIGFFSNASEGVDFRDAPQSNGTSSQYLAMDLISGLGVDITDRFSVGASIALGISFWDCPLVGDSAMVPDYAVRGALGATYELGSDSTIGIYWQTRKSFTFVDAVALFRPPPATSSFENVRLDHPETLGIGLSNKSLMGGKLLLAADVLFKRYSDAAFLEAFYKDQWIYQCGAQYSPTDRLKLRLGYAYHENPMRETVAASAGGVVLPGSVYAHHYVQALVAAIPQHRLTGGVGIKDVLPGVDFDLFAGGMFERTQTFGSTTTATAATYWVGAGITWRFGRGACEHGEWK